MKPDIESSGIGFDDWGVNNVVAFQYGEAGGTTGLTWSGTTAYSAGTLISDGTNRELCISGWDLGRNHACLA